MNDRKRAALVFELIEAGHGSRIVLSSNAIGVAKGHPDYDLPFSHVVSTFVPFLSSLGLSDDRAWPNLVHVLNYPRNHET